MRDGPGEKLSHRIADIIKSMVESGEPRELPVLFDKASTDYYITSDVDIVQYCFNRGLFEICRGVNQKDIKITKRQRTREERLAELNVPHEMRPLILRLGMDNVRCPLRHNEYVDLYGPKQASAEELRSAAQAYDPQIKSLQSARTLLFKLAKLVEKRQR
jgi:hypothetical protein